MSNLLLQFSVKVEIYFLMNQGDKNIKKILAKARKFNVKIKKVIKRKKIRTQKIYFNSFGIHSKINLKYSNLTIK
jgi:hypothetical protein